jgi:hypothetical protein
MIHNGSHVLGSVGLNIVTRTQTFLKTRLIGEGRLFSPKGIGYIPKHAHFPLKPSINYRKSGNIEKRWSQGRERRMNVLIETNMVI